MGGSIIFFGGGDFITIKQINILKKKKKNTGGFLFCGDLQKKLGMGRVGRGDPPPANSPNIQSRLAHSRLAHSRLAPKP